jgi:hypothetical protein
MVKAISESLEKRIKLNDLKMQLAFRILKGKFSDYWDNVEAYIREE